MYFVNEFVFIGIVDTLLLATTRREERIIFTSKLGLINAVWIIQHCYYSI